MAKKSYTLLLTVLMTFLTGCQSTEEKAAREELIKLKQISPASADKFIQDTFVVDSGVRNIVCGRFLGNLFVYNSGSGGIIMESHNEEYLDFYWVICSSKNEVAANKAEKAAKHFLKMSNNFKIEEVLSAVKGWSVLTENSKIDDSLTVILSIDSNEEIEGNLSIDKARPSLMVRCMENHTNVIISWNRYLGINSTTMTTRLDKDKAITQEWQLSTANDSVFSTSAITFAKSMFKKDKLLARITPYGSNPVTATFNVSDLEVKIKPLREACNW